MTFTVINTLGSIVNVVLDPLFMFVIFPGGYEVLGAGIATMLSNFVSMAYFIIVFVKLRDKKVLTISHHIENISSENKRWLYSVGIPAAVAVFLFDLVSIVINRLMVDYGDISLAAMGIVLKLERIPINTGLGICLGMVPLVAYNYGSGDRDRMKRIFRLAAVAVLAFSCMCTACFYSLITEP